MKVRQDSESSPRDPYQGVSLVLLAAAILGGVAAFVAGLMLGNPVMLAASLSLALAAGVLVGVLKAQATRTRHASTEEWSSEPQSQPSDSSPVSSLPPSVVEKKVSVFRRGMTQVQQWLRDPDIRVERVVAFGGGSLAALLLIEARYSSADSPSPRIAVIAILLSLGAAGLVATAARYLGQIEATRFPESPGLCRGARVIAWIFVLVAVSVALAWAGAEAAFRALYLIVLIVDAAVCYSLFRDDSARSTPTVFPLNIGVLSVLGRRANILMSVLDATEQQLGIDLRSTWALMIVRRSLGPLVAGLCLVGWLSTSLTVVGVEEQGLVERLGVALAAAPLQPGLHIHWPWPVDRVFRIPVQRVQTVQVGHEGEEQEGPENVLWAVEHAPNEYTLLLGNGRDLITVDAAVQYRIVDARAWRYHCQNPAAALRDIAYRAVMRSTVDLTLSEALSQNLSILTAKMRTMVQKEVDDLGLGVEILAFTVSGMHPPVPVAPAYEAVVSAQLGMVTQTTEAQGFRIQMVLAAESSMLTGENKARAEGLESLAVAAGKAWSFRTLEAQYRTAPQEYFFRRRLETLEKNLQGHSYTVVDSRFLRDGGEIWMPK